MTDPRASTPWPSTPGSRPPTAGGGAPPPPGGWAAPGAPGTPGTGRPGAPSYGPGTPGALPSWAPTPAPPPPPPPPRSPWQRALPFVVVAVVVGVLAAALTWLVLRDGDSETAAATTTTTATTVAPPAVPAPGTDPDASPPGTAPSPSVDPAELEAVVKELQTFVASERGMPFLHDVTVELLDDAAFEERLVADLEDHAEEVELQQKLYAALGIIEPDTDLMAIQRRLLQAGVLGFYDPETDELVVRGAALTPFVKETIVHELVHAHDDQHVELHRPEYDERDDETAFGFSATVEGNARRIQRAWVDTLTQDERAERTAEELRFGLRADLRGIPMLLIDMITAPYQLGAVLVEDVLERGGESAVTEVLTTPPTTSEQVILPTKLAAGEGAVPVATPPAGAEAIDEGAFGMLMVQLMLGDVIGDDAAHVAAAGWAGDRYVAWDTPDGATCVRVHLQYDTPSDVLDLLWGFEAYTEEVPHVSAQLVDPLTVEVNGCSESAASGGSSL